MHEIKSPFLILMEEQSYLAQSLESAFEKQNVKVKIVTIAEASSIVISEKPSGYLICTSPELLKKAVSVKVMVDQAIKNKTPVFIMGNIDELELLWETLPQQMVMDVFTRPITVGDMVDNVCTQMNDFYQLKKRTILAVDDSGIILRKIKALLEDTYQVVLANSGAMAIKYLTLNTPDLILLDYAMPIVDGIAMTIIKRVAREICRFTVSKSLAWYAVERLGTLDAAKEDAMEIGTLVRTIN